jgi:peroxiredoxin/DNA-binding transcriptional ArsR family regulator
MAERDVAAARAADDSMTSDVSEYGQWLTALFESPERARIFSMVVENPVAPDEIAAKSGLPSDVVAAHLSTLEQLGMILTDVGGGRAVCRLDNASIRRAADALAAKPGDVRTLAGRPAPRFRLPAADGREIALADCLEAGPVVLWFSSGLACPICRRNRARLSLCYPTIRSLGAEILEVTPTPPAHARMYYSRFSLSFPYLCDPGQRVWKQYGLRPGRLGVLHVLGVLLPDLIGPKTVLREWVHGPPINASPEEYRALGNEYGFFLIDGAGTIRRAEAGPYMGLPSNPEIERQLRELMSDVGKSRLP